MATTFKNYREESKGNWGAWCEPNQNISNEQLQTGALLRIADATEKMAGNFIRLQNDHDMYKRRYENELADNRRLQKQIAGLKGVITKLKKKALNP